MNKKIWEILVPDSSISDWKITFDKIINNNQNGEMFLPLKDNKNNILMFSWNSIPIEGKNNFCFIGRKISNNYVKNAGIGKNNQKIEKSNLKETIELPKNNNDKKEIRNYIKTDKTIGNKPSFKVKPNFFKKEPKNSKSFVDVQKNLERLNQKIQELEKNERKLVRKNKLLEKRIKNLNLNNNRKINSKIKKNKSEGNELIIFKEVKENKSTKNLFNFVKLNKKRTELEKKESEIKKIQKKVLMDRKNLDKKIAKFSDWKEKLICLESEIEKRRKNLVEQEEAFRDYFVSKDETPLELLDEKQIDVKSSGHHDILDKIPESAVVIQRGILKQINSNFASMMGFSPEELIDRSLFDFIAPEGLNDIENYYLSRLKGTSPDSYITTFLTKENNTLQVQVNIKPTIFNGEKAEIAIINNLQNNEEEKQTEDENEKSNEDKEVTDDISEDSAPSLDNENINDNGKEEKDDLTDHDKKQDEPIKNVNDIDNQKEEIDNSKDENVEEKTENIPTDIDKPIETEVKNDDVIDEKIKSEESNNDQKKPIEPLNKENNNEDAKKEKTEAEGSDIEQKISNETIKDINTDEKIDKKDGNIEDEASNNKQNNGKMDQDSINQLLKKMKNK